MAVPDNDSATPEIERLLLETIRSLYARDMQVVGLPELPVAQLRVLNALGREPEERRPTMGELAETLGVTLSTATQIVERIEKRGLVRREHSDSGDRRIVRLGLTDEGRSLVAERRRLRHERLDAVLGRLDAAQRQSIREALTPLAEAAHQVAQSGAHTETALLTLLGEVR